VAAALIDDQHEDLKMATGADFSNCIRRGAAYFLIL
jgi:hypothetical protein